jgi:predicted amidohydrolase
MMERGVIRQYLIILGGHIMINDVAARLTVTVGQIVLTSPEQISEQIAAVFQTNPSANLIVLPEFVTHGDGVDPRRIAYLATDDSARERAMYWLEHSAPSSVVQSLADTHRKAVVFGCLAERDGVLTSRSVFYDPVTAISAGYDKTHVHWTETFLRPGDALLPVPTRFGPLGMLICYDTAFPEAARVLGVQGAQLLSAIAATPEQFDWKYVHRRLSGIAIHNQCFVMAAHLGFSAEVPMGGHSAIFGPEGDVLAHIDHAAGGSTSAVLDFELLWRWRRSERTAPNRRPDLYRPLVACQQDKPPFNLR